MRLWYRTGDITALRELSRDRVVCLDAETTGLDPRSDEVLQMAKSCYLGTCDPNITQAGLWRGAPTASLLRWWKAVRLWRC